MIARAAFAYILIGFTALHAQALNTRTWVSGAGIDQPGCGPVATPCRTMQYAHDNTSVGGEINVLDPAGYGSVRINRAISIINDGGGTAGVLATKGTAISINAGPSADVVLRGLTIEGAKTANYGVDVFGNNRSVTIANSVIQGFAAAGIRYVPNSNATINVLNTEVAGNSNGIVMEPRDGSTRVDAVLNRVTITGNDFYGLRARGLFPTAPSTLRLTVTDSLIASNVVLGIALYSGNMAINAVVTGTVISMNGTGIELSGTTPSVMVVCPLKSGPP